MQKGNGTLVDGSVEVQDTTKDRSFQYKRGDMRRRYYKMLVDNFGGKMALRIYGSIHSAGKCAGRKSIMEEYGIAPKKKGPKPRASLQNPSSLVPPKASAVEQPSSVLVQTVNEVSPWWVLTGGAIGALVFEIVKVLF